MRHGIDRMGAVRLRQTADAHMGISVRLRLLHAVGGRQLVELGEVLVEELNQRRRLHGLGEAREPFEIGEQDGDRIVMARDDRAMLFSTARSAKYFGPNNRQQIRLSRIVASGPGHADAMQFSL